MTVLSFHTYLLKKWILNCHCSYFPSLKVQGACKSVLSVIFAGTVCRHSCYGRQWTNSHVLSWKGRVTSKLKVWQAMSNNSAIACCRSIFLLSSNILCHALTAMLPLSSPWKIKKNTLSVNRKRPGGKFFLSVPFSLPAGTLGRLVRKIQDCSETQCWVQGQRVQHKRKREQMCFWSQCPDNAWVVQNYISTDLYKKMGIWN